MLTEKRTDCLQFLISNSKKKWQQGLGFLPQVAYKWGQDLSSLRILNHCTCIWPHPAFRITFAGSPESQFGMWESNRVMWKFQDISTPAAWCCFFFRVFLRVGSNLREFQWIGMKEQQCEQTVTVDLPLTHESYNRYLYAKQRIVLLALLLHSSWRYHGFSWSPLEAVVHQENWAHLQNGETVTACC